jgi:N-acetylmuramoyl-L-alanine amidase
VARGGVGEAAEADDTEHAKVTAVRFWSLAGVTRIAIESTGEFHFHVDRLRNPERIFFDLVGTRPDAAVSGKGHIITVGDRYLRQIRVAETQHGVTRVVLDLVSNADFTTSQLENPDRLIVELHPLGYASSHGAKIPPPEREAKAERIALPDRPAPRLANLDFSFLEARREMERRVSQPVILDPPPPLDATIRYAAQSGRGDPLAALKLTASAPIPPPRAIGSMPGLLAKTTSAPVVVPTPKSIPEEIGMPAKRSAQGDTMIRVLGLKLQRVVIDPGHGGHDGGTTGPDGLHEKDVVLDVAKRLGELIQNRLGSEVVYTRTDDTFIPLSRRTDIANEIKADLFLSIHVNSSPVKAVAGVETYYLNFTTSKSALETAMRENAGAERNIGELQDLLKKIALKDKVDESREFAARIQTSLCTLDPKASHTSSDRGVKRAPFVVLIGASMPSVLAEIGFLSNSHEESLLRKPEYRQRIAEALYKGLSAYANSLSHFQVAQQAKPIGGTQ